MSLPIAHFQSFHNSYISSPFLLRAMLLFFNSIVPPPAATSLQEVSKTSNSIEIRWSVSGTGNSPITNITIDFAVGPSTNFTRYLATSNPNLRELNVSNLQPFTSYRFRVTLVNAVGASAPSVTGALQTCSAGMESARVRSCHQISLIKIFHEAIILEL